MKIKLLVEEAIQDTNTSKRIQQHIIKPSTELVVDLKGCDEKAKELFMKIDNNQLNKGEQVIVKKKGVNELKALEFDANFWSYG